MLSEHAKARASAEVDLLLCCGRTVLDEHCHERLKFLTSQELDWPYLLRLALMHRVLPLLYSNLSRAMPEAVPIRILDELRRLFRGNVERNLFLTAELLKLARAFETQGIPAVPFKGPVLAVSAYQDLGLRQFGDLDILVHRRDIVEAGAVIVSQGYRSNLDKNDTAHNHGSDPDEVAYRGAQYYTFNRSDRRSKVDLQWRIAQQYFSFSIDQERLWERLAPVCVAGRTVRTFAPSDMLLILCVHGSKHRWDKLKWVCDVAELVRVHKCEIDWEEIQQQARKQKAKRMLGLGLLLAQELVGAELPSEISKQIHGNAMTKRIAQQIRNRLFLQAGQPLGKFKKVIFYIRTRDHWQEGAQFCLRYVSQYCQAIITPTRIERKILPLPMSLSFLYFVFRPVRLLRKHGWAALRRVINNVRINLTL
jgi:hypothetical protein